MLTDFETIRINEAIRLTEIRESDWESYVEVLNEPEYHERTGRIPFPYTKADAQDWIRHNRNERKQGLIGEWAIRNAEDKLIGGAGFTKGFQIGETHKAEIGYWLAKPYWGQGITVEVVKKLCELAFERFGLVRITAHIYAFNVASIRVAEKCGFKLEGDLKKYYLRDGKYFDGKLYSRVI